MKCATAEELNSIDILQFLGHHEIAILVFKKRAKYTYLCWSKSYLVRDIELTTNDLREILEAATSHRI